MATDQQGDVVAAGWYADPTDGGLMPWWSGERWSVHVWPRSDDPVVAQPAGSMVTASPLVLSNGWPRFGRYWAGHFTSFVGDASMFCHDIEKGVVTIQLAGLYSQFKLVVGALGTSTSDAATYTVLIDGTAAKSGAVSTSTSLADGTLIFNTPGAQAVEIDISVPAGVGFIFEVPAGLK